MQVVAFARLREREREREGGAEKAVPECLLVEVSRCMWPLQNVLEGVQGSFVTGGGRGWLKEDRGTRGRSG